MHDDKPRAAIRYLLHDWTRLYTALCEAGCEREQAEKVATAATAARHTRPARRADLQPPDHDWIDGRWAPKSERTP